jgi:hypothetical protein
LGLLSSAILIDKKCRDLCRGIQPAAFASTGPIRDRDMQ